MINIMFFCSNSFYKVQKQYNTCAGSATHFDPGYFSTRRWQCSCTSIPGQAIYNQQHQHQLQMIWRKWSTVYCWNWKQNWLQIL